MPPSQRARPPQEWEAFLAALKRPLPITFRINGAGSAHADRLREKLAGEFLGQFSEGAIEVSGGRAGATDLRWRRAAWCS